jgi:large subunit ribosomal protein L17
MRHRTRVSTFGRKTGPRKALLRGLVSSLVEHGRIKTTLAKAKELRRHVERAVTMGKKGTLHARRILLSRYPNDETVSKIMSDWAPKMATRPGGYTQILKIGMRPGDRAEMAYIQFMGHEAKPVDEVAMKKIVRKNTKLAIKKKKHLRTIQKDSRKVSRLHNA